MLQISRSTVCLYTVGIYHSHSAFGLESDTALGVLHVYVAMLCNVTWVTSNTTSFCGLSMLSTLENSYKLERS